MSSISSGSRSSARCCSVGALADHRIRADRRSTLAEFGRPSDATFYTMLRVIALIALATLDLGSDRRVDRPASADRRESPAAGAVSRGLPGQCRLFPIAVIGILHFQLNPDIWLSRADRLRHAMVYRLQRHRRRRAPSPTICARRRRISGIKGWIWWKKRDPAGDLPLLHHRRAHRLGRLLERRHRRRICQMGRRHGDARMASAPISPRRPQTGDYPKIVLGVAVMSVFVILFNRLFWRPLFRLRRTPSAALVRFTMLDSPPPTPLLERQRMSRKPTDGVGGEQGALGARQCLARPQRGRDRRPARPFGLRQIHAAAHRLRA